MKSKVIIVSSNIDESISSFIDILESHFKNLMPLKFSVVNSKYFQKNNIEADDLIIYILSKNNFEELSKISELASKLTNRIVFIGSLKNKFILGPTYLNSANALADSAYLSHLNYENGCFPEYDELVHLELDDFGKSLDYNRGLTYHKFLNALIEETYGVITKSSTARCVDHVEVYQRKKDRIRNYILPIFDRDKTSSINGNDFDNFVRLYANSKKQIKGKNFFSERILNKESVYQKVGIIGGGTSGYLSALAMKKKFPFLDVTIIESSKIPIIGVGEATTPSIVRFLFNTLGFDKSEFYKNVNPTCKLGIKFDWGLPNQYFNFPFGRAEILASQLNHGNINFSSLESFLMSKDSSLLFKEIYHNDSNEEKPKHFSEILSHAFHIDNKSFVNYLKVKANDLKINLIDDKIIDVVKASNSDDILSVVGENGSNYKFDFFIDCSGFKSLLLEKTLKSDFISFNDALFTNCAITAKRPNDGLIKPYTLAETFNYGWCWHTPMNTEDHLGYVFSLDHCSKDEATNELKINYPDSIIQNTVHFKSGRHKEIIKGNVYAVGNSYAFVEPLESTGIYMIIKEIEYLLQIYEILKISKEIRTSINQTIGDHWDYLKFFLAIHFKYNTSNSSNFWKDCNEKINISEYQWLIDLYESAGPLSYIDEKSLKFVRNRIPDSLFGFSGIDNILMGQGFFPKRIYESKINDRVWSYNLSNWERIERSTRDIKGSHFPS